MTIRKEKFNEKSGFVNDANGDVVIALKKHRHYILYTPKKGMGGPSGYHENTFYSWDIHDILDEDTLIDRVNARCREILEERSKKEV